MGLNETPSAERVHIGFFGKRNAGKSSVVTAVTGQNLAVVSDVKGTTTDPVQKAMELLPLGPVVVIDTPGLDDEGELGSLRVKKSREVLNRADAAVLVVDGTLGMSREDWEILKDIRKKEIPFVIAWNKADLKGRDPEQEEGLKELKDSGHLVEVSANSLAGIGLLKERIAALAKGEENEKRIIGDFLNPDDVAVLVVPIDKAAPKGRLILPQQQTIRDILEAGGIAVVSRETELGTALKSLAGPPKVVITDSQVFDRVSRETPEDILLTSFSILFARYKGNLAQAVQGVTALNRLENGDRVLISEGCTHHRQCNDIGTVKLPGWIRKYTGKEPEFCFTSGREFPDDLTPYRLVVHCGGCMLNEREMRWRLRCAEDQGIPMTNYGILIAYVNGILERSVQIFPDIAEILKRG